MSFNLVTHRCADNIATATSAAGAAATATITGASGMSTYVTHVTASYDTAATAGTVSIKDGTTVIWIASLKPGGVIDLSFEGSPLKITRGADALAVISAGGGSVVAYANISGYQV